MLYQAIDVKLCHSKSFNSNCEHHNLTPTNTDADPKLGPIPLPRPRAIGNSVVLTHFVFIFSLKLAVFIIYQLSFQSSCSTLLPIFSDNIKLWQHRFDLYMMKLTIRLDDLHK